MFDLNDYGICIERLDAIIEHEEISTTAICDYINDKCLFNNSKDKVENVLTSIKVSNIYGRQKNGDKDNSIDIITYYNDSVSDFENIWRSETTFDSDIWNGGRARSKFFAIYPAVDYSDNHFYMDGKYSLGDLWANMKIIYNINENDDLKIIIVRWIYSIIDKNKKEEFLDKIWSSKQPILIC